MRKFTTKSPEKPAERAPAPVVRQFPPPAPVPAAPAPRARGPVIVEIEHDDAGHMSRVIIDGANPRTVEIIRNAEGRMKRLIIRGIK